MQTNTDAYRVPGFGWVRGFTALILVGTAGLVGGVIGLMTLAEMDVTVSGTGAVEPVRRFRIKSTMEGTIRTIGVASGDAVEVGQVVAELDDTALRSQLAKVERDLEANQLQQAAYLHARKRDLTLFEAEKQKAAARVETASLQLEQVSREYRLYYEHSPALKGRKRPPVEKLLPVRLREAVHKQAMAELESATRKIETLRDGKLELRRLKAEHKKLQQDRFLLRHRIDAMQVRSEVAGTVLTREVEQLVGDRVQKGGTILEVAELGRWQVKTLVNELDFPKVRIGQDARVYLEAFPYTEFEVFDGRVSKLPRRNETAAGPEAPTAYPVVISLKADSVTDGEKRYSLSYGMKASAKIVIERGGVIEVLWRQLLRSVGRLGKPEVRLARKAAST